MNDKVIRIIIEVVIVIVLLGWYTYKEVIPELKEKYGSSDKIINSNLYKNMIELNIDNTNFILVINKKNSIYHIFFLDKTSLVLHNKNIENTSIDNGLNKTIELLISNDLLNNSSSITLTRYNDESYNEFLSSFKKVLEKYNLTNEIVEKTNTIENKCLELGINNDYLVNLDMYSKSISGIGNNNIVINKDTKELSNNVYKKIEEYIFNNNIDNLDKNNTELVITLIPSDKTLNYYPTSNSWYYVKDKKIYAYIEFQIDNKTSGYCYNGSIDLISEGECTSWINISK